MKGLQEKTGTGTIYLAIKHNSLCQESKEPVVGFEEIEAKHPRTGDVSTKYIKRFNGVEALVCKIEWYEREYQDTTFQGWKLHLNADGVPCVLDLPFSSRVGSRFMKLAENIDFTQPVEFRAWYDKKSESTAFFVGQNGQSVPQLYTKDEPGDCPPPVQNKVSKKWNFDSQNEFLYSRMIEVVIPAVEEAGNEMPQLAQAASASVAPQSHVPTEDIDDDEIPF